jgi:23S rRNA pseudouridine1911/1915/1917 synthase
MDWARECVTHSGVGEPFVVMSRVQTAGRGRGGSAWVQGSPGSGETGLSDTGHSIHASLAEAVATNACFGPCTFVLPASALKIPLTWMSLAVGCALSDAIQAVRRRLENQLDFSKLFPSKNVFEPRIKWPNDLWAWPSSVHSSEQIRGRKIAGVLCESSFRGDALQYVTVGIGLNTFSSPASVVHAGSLLDLWGISNKSISSVQARQLETLLAEEIERELNEYLGVQRTPQQLQALVLERSLPRGTHMSVNKGEVSGAFLGVSPEGGLLLEGLDAPVLVGDVALPLFENTPSLGQVAASGRAPARLCLDFGNSHIHWRCESGAGLLQGNVGWNAVDKKIVQDARAFARLEFARLIVEHLRQSTQVELVWSAVSHAGMTAKVIAAIENLLVENSPGREIALHPLHADEILQACALAGDYAPEQMGVDRALQAWVAAGEARAGASAVAVISSGTALTGLVVSATGRMLDSFILPGASLGLTALHEKTARLPSLSLPRALPSKREEPPFNTQQSMLRGLTLQCLGLVWSLVQLHDVRTVILTGGGAEILLDLLENEFPVALQIEKDLVLRAMSDFVAAQSQSRFRLMADEGEGETGLPEKVLQSMLRARLSKRRSQRVALDPAHFRRLGGRLEHVGVGLRIDRHLGEKFKFHTRDIWRERIDIGEVMIEQNSPKNHLSNIAPSTLINIKSTYVLKQGDQVWLFHPPEYEPDMATHVEVVHDDGDAAVFCKPGNLVVHAAGLYGKNTFIEIAKKMGYGDAAPVHRIDRETSGLLVCARSTPLRRDLSLSFRDASVKKMYLAVTRGQREVPERFRVNFPIGNAVNSRIRLKLWHNPQEGLDALTHCVRLARWEDYTLFACLPQTGRTNQIRVHLAAIGHWIVGDKMYHPNEEVFLKFYEEGYTDFVAENVLLPRHWLHNTGIQFLGKPESPLGRAPVIAPLTEDLLVHNPTLELLRTAGFPLESHLQKTAFAKLFADLLLLDFSRTEIVVPEA